MEGFHIFIPMAAIEVVAVFGDSGEVDDTE